MKKKLLIVCSVIVLLLFVQFVMGYAGPFVDINYQQKIEDRYKNKPDWFLLSKLFSLNYAKKNSAYYLLLQRNNEKFFSYLRFIAGKKIFKDDAEYAVTMLCKHGTEDDMKNYCSE